MEEQSNEALWYVVHTYSGYENKVATDLQTMVENRRLQDLICDIKVPTEMVPEIFLWYMPVICLNMTLGQMIVFIKGKMIKNIL